MILQRRQTVNILQLIETSEEGGAETVMLSLAKSLRERGHNCTMGLLQMGWLNDELKKAGFETIIMRQKISYDLACLWNLVALIRKRKIDIVHAHEFMMNTYGTLAGILTRTPVITTVHGKNYYWEKKRRRAAYRVVSRFSKMVAVSEDMGRFLAKEVGISKRRITTIYNGVDFKGHNGSPSSRVAAATREALSIPAQSPIIATVGRLVAVKDHSTLLKAAVKVIRSCPAVIFLICGDGELRGRLENEARELGIAENVRFAGFRNDIFDLLQISDVYVCSSLSEGLSLSILEAMAAGKPVIATNVGGNPEVVVNGETGILVPPQDPEILASRIVSLLRDKPLSQQFGLKGQWRTDEKFSYERMVHSYQQLYEEALLTI
jgi:glycosyltransferase involved in cell wall biosynthesis